MDLAEIKKEWTEEFEIPDHVVTWLIAEVERLNSLVATLREDCRHTEEHAKSSLTRSKAEGRREGMERALQALREADWAFPTYEETFDCAVEVIKKEVAAIRQQAVQTTSQLPDGEPCGHAGCLQHVTHHYEGCGRIAGRAVQK